MSSTALSVRDSIGSASGQLGSLLAGLTSLRP